VTYQRCPPTLSTSSGLVSLHNSLFSARRVTNTHIAPDRRREDHSALPFIANEIYLEIFDYFVPSQHVFSEAECRSILANLALVCRFFCAVSLPRIFKTITFTPNGNTNFGGQSDWCKKVINNHKSAISLAAYVKTCRFSDWGPPPRFGVWVYSACLTQRTEAFSRFQNLESLYLTEVSITQPFFLYVVAKDTLKSVSIIDCEFKPPEREWDLSRFQPRWSTIHIARSLPYTGSYTGPLSILASSPNLQTYDVDDDDLADAIFSRPVQFDKLRELFVRKPDTLEAFLDRTPSIETLHWMPGPNTTSHSLTHKSLPCIQEVSCTTINDHLLSELITKPSLQRIRLSRSVNGGADNQVIWELLQRAGRSVRLLAIPIHVYSCAPLYTKFPVLDKLEISCYSRTGSKVSRQSPSFMTQYFALMLYSQYPHL
jgi:hypothetical protein